MRWWIKKYEPGEQAKAGVVGAGGVDFFRFKALKKGEARITMTYKRAWQEGVVDQKVFTVNVK